MYYSCVPCCSLMFSLTKDTIMRPGYDQLLVRINWNILVVTLCVCSLDVRVCSEAYWVNIWCRTVVHSTLADQTVTSLINNFFYILFPTLFLIITLYFYVFNNWHFIILWHIKTGLTLAQNQGSGDASRKIITTKLILECKNEGSATE